MRCSRWGWGGEVEERCVMREWGLYIWLAGNWWYAMLCYAMCYAISSYQFLQYSIRSYCMQCYEIRGKWCRREERWIKSKGRIKVRRILTMVVLSREELKEVTARVCPVIALTPASHHIASHHIWDDVEDMRWQIAQNEWGRVVQYSELAVTHPVRIHHT